MTDPLRPVPPATSFEAAALIGKSACMRAIQQALPCLARADLNLVLCGESGTGKRPWAHAIHDHGARQARPFVAVRALALAADESTLEAKLFGAAGREGVLGRAGGGTLYLDGVEAL